jgi:hypothetical protein
MTPSELFAWIAFGIVGIATIIVVIVVVLIIAGWL